jgi:hypothetical protein
MRRATFAFFILFAITFVAGENVRAQSTPAFSTETPNSGVLGSTFVVLLPIFNTGSAEADNVQVTSVTLGHAAPISPVLAPAVGTLAPGDHYEIHLQFDATKLFTGQNYLLSVRGTYTNGTQTSGFAVNRILKVFIAVGPAQAELRRWIVLDAIKERFASRSRLDPNADNEEMLSFLQTFPDFVDSGIDADSSSVWATFADGHAIIIANDRTVGATAASSVATIARSRMAVPQAPSKSPQVHSGLSFVSAPEPSGPPSEIPQSNAARLLNTLGSGYDITTKDLTSWLGGNGYRPLNGADASVDSLKSLKKVAGDGVFYIDSHGGFHAGKGVYSVWTSTVADDWTDARFLGDWAPLPPDPPTLFHMLADLTTGDSPVEEWHYSFNANFVKTYFNSFSPNSFVYIDACSSDSPKAQDFKQAFLKQKASLYAGWTGTVDDSDSAPTARLVFDRLLGANEFCPETSPEALVTPCVAGQAPSGIFPQRPFDYQSVSSDISHHITPPSAFLNFTAGSGQFGLLAPSISNMKVDESVGAGGQLTVLGNFGTDPRTTGGGSVQVAGNDASIVSWDPVAIVVDLAAAASGNVQVIVRQHKSNVATLTMWQGQFNFLSSGPQSVNETITYNLNFRQDVRKYRDEIHFPPIEPSNLSFSVMNTSNASYSCSGSDKQGDSVQTTTWMWVGSGTLTPTYTLGFGPFFSVDAQLLDSRAMKFNLFAQFLGNACITSFTIAPPGVTFTGTDPGLGLSVFTPLSLSLDDAANILVPMPPLQTNIVFPQTRDITPATVTLQWNKIAPISPPDPKSAR